jgi:hypothetical protein
MIARQERFEIPIPMANANVECEGAPICKVLGSLVEMIATLQEENEDLKRTIEWLRDRSSDE